MLVRLPTAMKLFSCDGPLHPLHAGLALALLGAVALATIDCGPKVHTPHYVAQPASALVQVQTPPPPARVETVPPQPRDGAVWLDGEWAWQGRKWAWRRGRWVMPPSGTSYAPWTVTRDEAGGVWFAAGAFRNAQGEEIVEPEPLATAAAGHTEVTDANGEKEETSTIRDHKGRDGGAR